MAPAAAHACFQRDGAPLAVNAVPAASSVVIAPPESAKHHASKHAIAEAAPGSAYNNVLPVPPSPSKRARTTDAFLAHPPPLSPSRHASAAVSAPATSSATDLAKALKAVVKVFCTTAKPNYAQPWQMLNQSKSTASGFAISPLSSRRILTNAHAVANQIQVQLRKHGNAKKFTAKVLAVGHECDIALLTVEEDEFWEGVEALDIGGLPPMQESVTVVGFPQGGDNVCVTKGVVSRLDRLQYSHGCTSLLAVQIDAAINSGNSGGPVLLGGSVAGIAFQCLTSGESIGYIIPTPVVNHFLRDLHLHAGRYTGFCELGACWQGLESTDMKRSLGMPPGMTGIYVTATEPLYHASKMLRPGDVITSFNGHQLADDGTFSFSQDVRIDFRHLVSLNYHGGTATLRVWRDGCLHDVEVALSNPRQLVPIHSHDKDPAYHIFAGMVFTPLTKFYLRSLYGDGWVSKAPIKLCDRVFAGRMEQEGQEVVVLSKVLAHDVNTGYQDIANIQVKAVNGAKVHNLAHLAALVEASTTEYTRFDLEWNKVVIVNTAKARAAAASILRQNGIPSGSSDGLMEAAQQLPPSFLPALKEERAAEEEAKEDEQVQEEEEGPGGRDEEAMEAVTAGLATNCKL